MEELTPRQEEYLLLFAARSGHENCVSEAAQRFGVSKATVSVVSSALTRCGMIEKSEQGEISLTQEGWEYIGTKLETARAVTECLTTRLGLSPLTSEMEASRIVVSLEPETVKAMLESWQPEPGTETHRSHHPIFGLQDGVWEVPFEVRKASRQELSMGDRGFLKPAELVVRDGESTFLLHTERFSYKPLRRKWLVGSLERLWYQMDEVWHESRSNSEGSYSIPAEALRYEQGGTPHVGVVRIRARATVGLCKMPESEADLVFQLDGLAGK